MGTRNLTIVVLNGQYKVAQYAQWDGYPTGQGVTACNFIQKKMDLPKFKTEVEKVTNITSADLKNLWVEYGADRDSDLVSFDVAEKLERAHPEFSRNTGAGILELIQNGTTVLNNDLDFAADSLFCEWAYVLDLDNEVLEVYAGFNQTPLKEGDRFYFLQEKSKGEYSPVKLLKSYEFKDATKSAMEKLESTPSDDEAAV